MCGVRREEFFPGDVRPSCPPPPHHHPDPTPQGQDRASLRRRLLAAAARGYVAAAPDARHHGGRLLGDGEAREEYQGALVRRAGSTGVLVGSGRGSATPLPRPPPTPPPPLTSFPLSRALRGHTPARPFLLDNVWDLGRVLDYLSSRPDVDASRIGVTGISLGGMHAWLLAAADDRVTVAAPALGVQSFAWAAAHDAWHARAASLPLLFDAAAADAGLPAPDAAAFARALDAVAPGLRTVRRHGGRRGGWGRGGRVPNEDRGRRGG